MAAKTDNNENNLETKAIVATRTGPSGVMIAGQRFEVVQQVNVPILKHETGETVAVRIELPLRTETSDRLVEVTDPRTGEVIKGSQEVPITVARVTELGSGQLFQLVLNAISASEFERAYPNAGYVGKCFAIKKLGLVAGKRYKDVQIVEIQPNAAA